MSWVSRLSRGSIGTSAIVRLWLGYLSRMIRVYDTGLLIECFHRGDFLRMAVEDIEFGFNRIWFLSPVEVLSFSFSCLEFLFSKFFFFLHNNGPCPNARCKTERDKPSMECWSLPLPQLPPFWLEANNKIRSDGFSHFMIWQQLVRQYKLW